MSLTICTVVYNEEKNVGTISQNMECLRHHWPTARLLIIDNASTDSTLKQLRQTFWADHAIFLQRQQNHLGEARQQAMETCQTAWLCFLDADCTISVPWIVQAKKTLDSQPLHVAGVGGAWCPGGAWAALYQNLFSTVLGHAGLPYLQKPSVPAQVFHLPTAAVIYRKEALIRAGGFDGDAQLVGEDLQMSYKLHQAGYTLVLDPALNFEHILPANFLIWWKKMWRYGTARGKMVWMFPQMWAQRGLWVWAFLSALGLVMVFLGRPLLALGFCFFYLFFCVVVCWWSSPRDWQKVYLLMLGTHWFYGAGMLWGLLRAGLGWRPFSLPMRKA